MAGSIGTFGPPALFTRPDCCLGLTVLLVARLQLGPKDILRPIWEVNDDGWGAGGIVAVGSPPSSSTPQPPTTGRTSGRGYVVCMRE